MNGRDDEASPRSLGRAVRALGRLFEFAILAVALLVAWREFRWYGGFAVLAFVIVMMGLEWLGRRNLLYVVGYLLPFATWRFVTGTFDPVIDISVFGVAVVLTEGLVLLGLPRRGGRPPDGNGGTEGFRWGAFPLKCRKLGRLI